MKSKHVTHLFFIIINKVIIMNTIKQTISKKFIIKSMYKWGFVGGAIVWGMYDTGQRLNDDVLCDCMEGIFRGGLIWGCGPME